MNNALLALLLIATAAQADEEVAHHDKPQDPAALITRHGKDMGASHIKAEHVQDGTILLCFRKANLNNPLADCFVVNDFTGDVKLVELAIDETII